MVDNHKIINQEHGGNYAINNFNLLNFTIYNHCVAIALEEGNLATIM